MTLGGLSLFWEWSVNLVADTVTAAVLAGLALLVGVLARFKGPARHFAMFGTGFGLSVFVGNLAEAMRSAACGGLVSAECTWTSQHHVWQPALNIASIALAVVAIVGVVRLGRSYGIVGRWYAAAYGIPLWTVASIAWVLAALDAWITPVGLTGISVHAQVTILFVMMAYMSATTFGLAISYRREPKRDKIIMAAAMIAYPVAQAWGVSLGLGDFAGKYVHFALMASMGALLGIALWSRAGTPGDKGPRMVVAVIMAFALLAVASHVFWDGWSLAGVARTFDILLVSYAILRLQYLGLDVRVRWGISKSTVAAIFVAVIFLASEGAQIVFGEDEAWLGLAAGGALVFALAPLSRFADRVATAAVPSVDSGSESAYRRTLQRYLRDGHIDEDEEMHLADLAERLGIGARRALEMRREERA